jgi:defect-in-organelle-trafficking protein DotB
VPSVDGKRIALREYLAFDEEVRDILVGTEVELLAAKTRLLLKERGQPMIVDAKRKFEAGLLSERDYKIMEMRGKMLDKDAGIA